MTQLTDTSWSTGNFVPHSLRIFQNSCHELELLGFHLSSTQELNHNTAWVLVQRQLVATLDQKDKILSLKWEKEAFYERPTDTRIKNSSLEFWHSNVALGEAFMQEENVLKHMKRLNKDFVKYARKVTKTVEFNQLTFREQNAYILPFYLARYDHQICSAMLPYNITAGDTLVTVLVSQKITLDDVDMFKDLPEEVLNAFI